MAQSKHGSKRCSCRKRRSDLDHERARLVLLGRSNRDARWLGGCSTCCGNAFRGGRAYGFIGLLLLGLWTFRNISLSGHGWLLTLLLT